MNAQGFLETLFKIETLRVHHTPDDTLDKIDPAAMDKTLRPTSFRLDGCQQQCERLGLACGHRFCATDGFGAADMISRASGIKKTVFRRFP